jgi:hypothetical protein
MTHDEHQNSTAWWGTCDNCLTSVVVFCHPEAADDLPDMGEWEGVGPDCYVCDHTISWGGSDAVKDVRL